MNMKPYETEEEQKAWIEIMKSKKITDPKEQEIYLRNQYLRQQLNKNYKKTLKLTNLTYFKDFVNKDEYIKEALNIELYKRPNRKNIEYVSNIIEVKTWRNPIECYYFIVNDNIRDFLNDKEHYRDYLHAYKIKPKIRIEYKKGKYKKQLVAYDITYTTKTKYKIDKNDIINYYNIEYNYNDGVFMKVF